MERGNALGALQKEDGRRVLGHRGHSCAQEGVGGLGGEYNIESHQLVKETDESERNIHTLCRMRTCCTPRC
jgi:hypothetical protein